MKNKTYIFKSIKLFIIIFFIFSAITQANAQDKKLPVLQAPDLKVSIPNSQTLEKVQCSDTSCEIPWIGQYIAGIQKYAIGIVGILAVIVLMIGGIIWLTAGGNQSQIEQSKKMIGGSLVGLFLVFGSYLILLLINPSLTKFEPLEIAYVKNIKLDTEDPIIGSFSNSTVSNTYENNSLSSLVYQEINNYNNRDLFSYIIKSAEAKCAFTLHLDNEGQTLDNNFLYENSVPPIHCPNSGGSREIPKIILSIYSKKIITYRYGGKGAFVTYSDGDADNVDHSCNQDPECTDQLKGHENKKNNCKYCCPKGQACLDCSGFVNHVLSCAGLPIIDSGTATMNSCGEKFKTINYNDNSVNGSPLVPGDLLVSNGHVIMYVGDGLTAESVPTPNKDDLDSGRRPGQGMLLTTLKRPPPYEEYTFKTIIRSSLATYKGQCIKTWDYNCTRNSDCCNSLDKCRKDPHGWKCWTGLIPDYEWDCESDNDCLSPSATCDFDQSQQRNKCVPH